MTSHQKTLIHFSLPVYALFLKLFVSIRKYFGIILSIANRLYMREKEKILFIYEIYFNLYRISIESNNLFPNDELIYLKKIKDSFTSKIKSKDNYEDNSKK